MTIPESSPHPQVPLPPHGGWPGAPRGPWPPQPVVVQVQAKPGGFTRAVLFVLGLALFALAFLVGVGFGVGSMIAGAEMDRVVLTETYRDGRGGDLAVLPLEGEVDDALAAFVHEAVDEIITSRAYKGVILRVDSPGGGVSASDQIWYEVERLKKAGYPVLASFGGMAASGGYYVSCGANGIVAEPTCITGSIGVIAQLLTFGETLEKVGIAPVTIVASGSPEKDTANDPYRIWNDKDRATIRTMLDAAYNTFLARVQAGRGHVITDPDALKGIADGTIYTTEQAVQNGLVDSIGYLDDAIAQLETRCGISTGRAKVIRLVQPPSLLGGLLGVARSDASSTGRDALDPTLIRRALEELASPRVLYRLH